MNQTELQHGCWDTAHSSFTRDLSWLCPKKYGTPKYSVWSKKCHSLVGCTSRCLRLYLIKWYKLVGFTPFLLVERLNLPFSNTARDGVSMLRSTVRNDGAIAVAWHDQMGDLAVLEPWNTLLSYFILLLYVFLLLMMIDSWTWWLIHENDDWFMTMMIDSWKWWLIHEKDDFQSGEMMIPIVGCFPIICRTIYEP